MGALLVALLLWGALPAPPALAELLQAHGYTAPTPDPALDRVAAGLLARLGGPVAPDPATASAHLRLLLEHAGVGDAEIHPFVALGGAAQLGRLVAGLDRRRPPTHSGFAEGADGALAVVLAHRGVAFDIPLPSKAPVGAVLTLRGSLRRGYARPRLVVAPPTGSVRERPAGAPERRVEVKIYLDAGPGAYGVELLADSVEGPVVLVNHRIYAGMEAPRVPTVRIWPPGEAEARDLLARVQGFRRARGLGILQLHGGLSQAAAEHAADLARAGRLIHRSVESGNLRTRLTALGIRAPLAAENLARAPEAGAALTAFLESPGHARNLLLPQVTHAGVARVDDFWVLLLAAPEP